MTCPAQFAAASTNNYICLEKSAKEKRKDVILLCWSKPYLIQVIIPSSYVLAGM